MELNWKNKDAIKKYLEISNKIGQPSVVAHSKGGIAIWKKEDLKNIKFFGRQNCFTEIYIRDEQIEHLCPKKHIDFLYSSIVVGVKPKQICMLSSISGSVIYDALKNTLTARCSSLEANIATLKLATDLLLNNKVNYVKQEIEYNNIESVHRSGAYEKLITGTQDIDFVKQLYSSLCVNIIALSADNKLNKGFWSGAFSYIDNKCLPPDKADKAGKIDKMDKAKVNMLGGDFDKPDKANKPDKMYKADKANKPDKIYKTYTTEKPDKIDKSGKAKVNMLGGDPDKIYKNKKYMISYTF